MKKFYAVVGNPPYQSDSVGGNDSYAPQIYNVFLDAAYEVGDKVEMVHPARFCLTLGVRRKRGTERCLRTLILRS